VSECDVGQGKVSVTKARDVPRDKDRTKTNEERLIELCQRAALRAGFELAGKLNHEELFFKGHGDPIRNRQYPRSVGSAA
jgi:hypothetical protein